MLKNTFIARASDGLILCETYDNVTDQQSNLFKISSSLIVERLKHNGKNLMKRLGSSTMGGSVTHDVQCTVDFEDHCFQ